MFYFVIRSLFLPNVLPVVLWCRCGLLRQAVGQHRVVGVNVKTAVSHCAWGVVENRDYKGKRKKQQQTFLVSALVLSSNLRNQIVDAQENDKKKEKKNNHRTCKTSAFWL